ncbi:tripartite tricarboxylate transporter substrate binding protein [soil metagenome]
MIKAATLKGVLAACVALTSHSAFAQAYPTKSVQLVTAFSAGSGVDFAARTVAERLSASLGQPFVVVNKPGAAGTVAASMVVNSPADGYTLLVTSAAMTLYPAMYPDLKFDTTKDLVSVASVVDTELVLVASPGKGWRTLGDMLAYARSKPGELTYGSAGVGTTTHMSFERLASAARFTGLHIPFKGTPEAVSEVLGGRVDAVYAVMSSALSLIKANQLVPLAIANRKRSAQLPNVPTTLEAGVPDSDYSSWTAVLAPAATPPAIVERLHTEINAILNAPDTAKKLLDGGLVPLPLTTDQFATQMRADFASNSKLAKSIPQSK